MSRRGPRPARTRNSRSESGYALLLAVFLAATMFLLATMAMPSIINQGRRDKDQELIWRGNQYVRGIRLYFQKNGRFPQNKDELLKGTLDVHFVRKNFTDPAGPTGADWRFIYVAPTGQLTGSVRYHTLQEMAAALGANQPGGAGLAALFGGAAAAPAGAAGGVGAAGAAGAAAGRGGGAPGSAAPGRGGPPGSPAAGAGAAQGGGFQAAGPTPVALQAVDGPVLGGSLVGVASKVKQPSLLVYQGKETYFEWEFIWNPLLNRGPGGAPTPPVPGGLPAGAGAGIGTGMPPVGGLGGGFGGAPNQQQGPAPGQFPGMPSMPGMPASR